MKSASSIIIVPGYGVAIAQAQHALCEVGDVMNREGVGVHYAIHPVASRMPGHMNMLLAEANVPYDEVFELEEIDRDFSQAGVAFVISVNDVISPAVRTDLVDLRHADPGRREGQDGAVHQALDGRRLRRRRE